MFPLGTVLLPGMLLPLHVFESRYRRLVEDCRAGEGTFGVVLIERGSEVGGGDARTNVGTLARILRTDELPDGRWLLAAVGMHRIKVHRWLPDDPYPLAEVEAWPDVVDEEAVSDWALSEEGWGEVAALVRRAAALRRELGEAAPPLGFELADDVVVASYQAMAAAPLGPADRQRLLEAGPLGVRRELLIALLNEQIEVLQARLGGA